MHDDSVDALAGCEDLAVEAVGDGLIEGREQVTVPVECHVDG
jgi:hypothetical protein